MARAAIKVLLLENSADDARRVRQLLLGPPGNRFDLVWERDLPSALKRFEARQIGVVLLDLSVCREPWPEALARMHVMWPQVPVILLTATQDESVATQAVKRGAQDYLVKGKLTEDMLERSIRYAIERQRLLSELRNLSLVDELTGLYNRRGFMTLADQQMKVAERAKAPMLLLFADLDDFKSINDRWGHGVGDRALRDAAALLAETFRQSDIVARLGGDEFAVLLVGAPAGAESVVEGNLDAALDRFNARSQAPYRLSLSVGTAQHTAESPCRLHALLAEADRAMYAAKRAKRQPPPSQPVGESRGNRQ
jgi:diguanylate cyclase (GGDEF)-like protein